MKVSHLPMGVRISVYEIYKVEVDMKTVLKKVLFIILSTIVTFLLMCVLGIILVAIHITVIQKITCMLWLYIIGTALFLHPFLAVTISSKIESLIEKCNKSQYTDVECSLIKIDILLAQLAGTNITFPLIAGSHRLNLVGFGGLCARIIIFGVMLGIGIPLVLKFFDICTNGLYFEIQMLLGNKKEKRAPQNKKIMATLLMLATLMCMLNFISFPLGKKLMQQPGSEEVLQKKTKIILENKDYIEAIRNYIENLDYEEIVACDEVIQEIDSLNVRYYKEKNYSSLYLDTEEVLRNIGLKDKKIVDLEGTIQVEFDTTTYEIRKISIAIGYIPHTQGTSEAVRLAWYCTGYYNSKPERAVLDDNWQIEHP